MIPSFEYTIVGAGIAGMKAAEAIRTIHPDATILLINGEKQPPYKRTKLSKLVGQPFDAEAIRLQPQSWFDSQHIALMHDLVKSFDIEKKIVRTSTHGNFQYGKLILATGSTPVLLPVRRNSGVNPLYFRNAADLVRLQNLLMVSNKILVAGGGVLGVELAAALAQQQKTVTLAHADTMLMGHQFDAFMADHLFGVLDQHGIQLLMHEKVKAYSKTGNGKLLVEIGEMIQLLIDELVVAIGVKPETTLAAKAGLKIGTGVLVDERMQTSNPDVYAAGDVVETPFGLSKGLWHESEHQGWMAGLNAAGKPSPLQAKHWRLKLEVFGHYYFAAGQLKQTFRDELTLRNETSYLRLVFEESKLIGVGMINLKEHAKTLERALNEHWSKDQAQAFFQPFFN